MGSCIGRHWQEVGVTKPPQLYTVIYDSENHLSVLFQCLGSAWPKVLPFCIFNVMSMIIVSLLDVGDDKIILSGEGHKFIRFVCSFLFVSRVSIALARFNECRTYLGTMYKASSKSTEF
jgi:predicted membrane chloride channel (bestrophin family)